MKVLFLDTNIFLQCHDLAEVPWDQVAGGTDLLLLIPMAVQGEIANLKSNGNSRRAKRARRANSFIRQIIQKEDLKIVLRDSNPHVEISFPPATKFQEMQFEGLDLSRSDDRIIAEALAYKSQHPNEDVAIITHDTNPILTAKRYNLPYIVIPDDWLLPPEPDDKDKRIAALEQQVRELRGVSPDIGVEAYDANGKSVRSLSMTILHYRQLEDREIQGFIDLAKSIYPMVTNFAVPPNRHGQDSSLTPLISPVLSNIFTGHRTPPTEEEIRKYKEKDYPAWLEELRTVLRSLSTNLEFPRRRIQFSISLTNQGTTPAENLMVEFKALGGLMLSPPVDEKQTGAFVPPKLPKPPQAPHWRFIRGMDSFSSMLETAKRLEGLVTPDYKFPYMDRSLLAGQKPRHRHAFYWKPERPRGYTHLWTFECDEFRHQVEAEDFAITIFVPPRVDRKRGALQCRITARNIPKPVVFILPIHIMHEHRDTMKEASQLLQEILP
jgi:hypothetical protein